MTQSFFLYKYSFFLIYLLQGCDHIVYCILYIYNVCVYIYTDKVQAKYDCLVHFHRRLLP